jgi:hypothetical protein
MDEPITSERDGRITAEPRSRPWGSAERLDGGGDAAAGDARLDMQVPASDPAVRIAPERGRFDLPPGSDASITVPVNRVAKIGVLLAMVVFAALVLAPLLLMVWGGFALVAAAAAGTALLHTGGLEPATFGTALTVGLSLAAMLLIVVVVAPGPRRDDDDVLEPGSWYARHPLWSRHPALVTLIGLVALASLAVMAAASRTPFFAYPWATVLLVAAVTFAAVVALVVLYRLVSVLWRAGFRWASGGPYRAGFATAGLLAAALTGAWAAHAGWTERPARRLADELALAAVPRPENLGEAAAQALCLLGDQVEPGLARSDAAPACGFLPGLDDGGARWPW